MRTLSLLPCMLLTLLSVEANADEAMDALCGTIADREEIELRDHALDVDLARSEERAAEEIYQLLDALRRNGHVERMLYLAGKHDRDATALRVRLRQLEHERQQAAVDEYRAVCPADGPSPSSAGERRRARDDARARFLRADCELLAVEGSLAEVDLEFSRELRESVLDLRRGEVATKQQVILAERDMEMAAKRLEHYRRLAAACETGGRGIDG